MLLKLSKYLFLSGMLFCMGLNNTVSAAAVDAKQPAAAANQPISQSEEKALSSADSNILDVKLTNPSVQLISNVVYEQVPIMGYANIAMQMDVLKPDGNTKHPAVVFIPGGGFIHANKDMYIQQRLALAEAGYVVASITYRVAPTAVFPQPVEDVKSAIRFLKANAAKFNIDPDKIGVLGNSAGGYLTAMTGASNGNKTFDKGDNLQESSDIKAAVDLYGLSDLTKVGEDFSPEVQAVHRSAGATEALWVNGSPIFGGRDGGILADKQKAEAANPIHYITKKSAPFLFMHGSADQLVSPSQTEIMHEALLKAGISSTRYVVKGAAHGGIYWVQPEVMKIIIDFFDKYLKN